MKYLKLFALLFALVTLGGCNEEKTLSDSGTEQQTATGQTPTTTGQTPTTTESYTLSAGTLTPIVVVGQGASITATITDGNQLAVGSAPVTFTVDNGAFTGNVKVITVNSDASGNATVALIAPVLVGSGKVTVSYSDKSATVNLSYVAGPAVHISLDASPPLVGVSSDSTLTAQLQDLYGNPIVNEVMQFTITAAGSGSPTLNGTGIVQTNSSGIATIPKYTSGAIVGTDTISAVPLNTASPEATVDITVNSSATTISSLTLKQELPSTSMKVGTTQGLTATVLDSEDKPVGGLQVAFEVVGAGDIAGEKLAFATTDENGIATVDLSAPLLVSSATIKASTGGLSQSISLTYIADVPASVTLSASPLTVGVSSDTTLTGTVYDQYGNVTPGEPVVFSIVTSTSGGTFTPSVGNAVTNTSGVATIVYTSGTTLGTDKLQIQATYGSAPVAQVDITVSSAASSIASLTLVQQQPTTKMKVGTTQELYATVLDNSSNPVEGQEVAFVIDGAGSIAGEKVGYATTNASGIATVTLTAPLLVNTASITASTAGLSKSISLSYIADVPASATLSATPLTVGVSSGSTLTAIIYDQHGNVTPDEAVVFSFDTNTSGGTLTPSTGNAVTNTSGVATTVYTSGTTLGIDTLQVQATNGSAPVAQVDITVSSAASSVASLTLVQQQPTTKMKVGTTQELYATVLDSDNDPVQGQNVAFVIEGAGSIAGDKVAYASTNASGIATVTLTAPLLVDSATVTTSTAGLSENLGLTYIADLPDSVTLTANPTSVGASSGSTLSATVYDQYGNVTPGEAVVFSFDTNASGATLTPSTGNATTGTNGVATIVFTSGSTAGVADIVAVDVTNGSAPSATVKINVTSGAVSVPSKMIISTDSTTIPSDNSAVATITLTMLDSVNVVVPGVTVNFAADGGVLSAGAAVTDANGEAVVTLSAGTDRANQTITVTASNPDVADASVPVNVTGSTVTISATRNNLIIGGTDTATLTIRAADAGETGVYNTAVTVYIDGSSTGGANLSIPGGGTTNTVGEWSVDLTGVSAGTVRVVAEALGATDFMDFLVESLDGSLIITAPESGVTTPINTATPIIISVPAGMTSLTLVSSLGTFSNASPAAGGSGTNILTWTGLASPTTVSADISSASIGTASINVADSNNTAITDSIRLIFVDEIVGASSTVSLQVSPGTVAPSTGETLNTAELIASVKNTSSEPIAGARVTFSMSNTTGSGEFIDPPVAYTDAYGVARANFYSGSQSTDSTGLVVEASLWETADSTQLADTSSASIIVGGTAGSIAIGTSTTVSSINENTGYSLPISLQVTDAGGNPVANTEVNVSVWPEQYALGFWACKPEPGIVREAVLANEDSDRDLHLGPGEDLSENGELTPPNSSAGSLPATVVTDEDGFATFHLTYLKDYAGFIYDSITATALVQGTETRATKRFWLPALKSDVTGCLLGESPLNTHWPILSSVAESYIVNLGGSTTITTKLTTAGNQPIDGASITATFLVSGSHDNLAPQVTGVNSGMNTDDTDLNGEVSFLYTPGDKAGTDWIKITYTTLSGVVIANYLEIVVE